MAGGTPSFDPNAPFETVGGAAPRFDSSKPFEEAKPEDKGGILRNIRAGFTEGLTTLPDMVMEGPRRLYEAVRPMLPETPARNALAEIPGSGGPAPEWKEGTIARPIHKALGKVGLNPEDVEANTGGERIARFAGMGASAAVLPGGPAKLLASGEKMATQIPRMASAPIATTARKALTGTGAGVGAGVGGEAVPDDMPVTKLLTQTAMAILGGGITEAVPAMAKGAGPAVRRMAGPLTAEGRDQLAADTLRERSSAPEGLAAALERPGIELVPGSKPTAGQAADDMGLLALEREQQTKDAVPFLERRAQQNTARREALTRIQSEGDPEAVGNFVRAHFAGVDEHAEQRLAALTAEAQEQAGKLGGAGSPDDYGAGLRDALQQAEDVAKAQERALWKAVDPDNSIRVDASPTFQAAAQIQQAMTRMAAPMEGAEKGIFEAIAGDKQLSLGELSDLRSRVSTAMREELLSAGKSPSYARLTQLRGAIQDNLADAAAGKVAQQAEAVAAGTMAAEDTIAGKIRGWLHDYQERKAADTGTGGGAGTGGSAPVRQAVDGGDDGAALSPDGGPSGSAGTEGLSEDAIPEPRPLNEEDAARLAEATAATKERAGTFGRGPVKDALAKAGTNDVYKLPQAKVPDKFFHAGPTSAADIRGLRKVIGEERANTLVSDFAATSLRRAAENPDGTIDPKRAAAWRRRHIGALSEFPELDEKLSTAAGASEAIEQAASAARAAVAERNATALGKVVKADNAEDVTKVIGGLLTGKTGRRAMGDLARTVAGNPEAKQGLRQAVADYITKNLISNTEAATTGDDLIKSDAFQTFLRKNSGALGEVFTPDEMKSMNAIAADLHRANRSIVATKIPGQSNTAQDIWSVIKNDPQASAFAKLVAEMGAGGGAGFVFGHLPGAMVGSAVAGLANAARRAGLKKVDDLVTEALLDPAMAKSLLRKSPPKGRDMAADAVKARLRRLAIATAAATHGGAPASFAEQ